MTLRVAYVTDQLLPSDATDTAQTMAMCAALGALDDVALTLVAPAHSHIKGVAELAAHYGVAPTFSLALLPGPYPAPLGLRGLEKVAHARNAARWVREHTTDLVYTRNLPAVWATLSRTDTPVVYETYRPWPEQSRFKRLLFSRLRRRERLIGLVLHSRLAAESYAWLGFSPEHLMVAHNAIDPAPFMNPLSPREARTRLGLPLDGPLVVYTGHISPDKGLDLLLDAAARLPAVQFVLVGSSGQGPIERRAASLPNVSVVGWQSSAAVPTWLMAADILVIPPTSRPLLKVGNTVLPIKTFQYLAAGRAIVAPRTPDLGEVLDDRNALLVPPDDREAFITALTWLCAEPARASILGDQARRGALERTWDRRARAVTDFLRTRLDVR